MARLELGERILLIELYFKNNESVSETFCAYKAQKGIKDSGDPFTRHTLINLVQGWRETGSVADQRGKRGRPSADEEAVETVKNALLHSAVFCPYHRRSISPHD